jgi:DNA-binding MarR family transcriptional regulator
MCEPAALAWVIVVMAAAGLAGGTINYLLLPAEPPKKGTDWLTNVAVSAAASFLIPLFLNTISSTLLANLLSGNGRAVDLLVFAGFCLLAALSAKAFIQSLSDRVLREAREARRQAQEARREVQVVEAALAPFVEPTQEQAQNMGAEAVAAVRQQLSEEEMRVLRAIRHERYLLRTSTGIAATAGIGGPAVQEHLRTLLTRDLVAKVDGRNRQVFWQLTPTGRAMAADRSTT